MDENLQHLKLLSVFHYVMAGLMAFSGCVPIIHVILGIVMLASPPNDDARMVGLVFVPVGLLLIIIGWSLAIAIFCAARNLRDLRSHRYCIVIAGIECLMVPLGTVLGVFTILVLMKPEVKELFDGEPFH